MEQYLAQIQVTISERGIIGIAVEADNETQTKSAYKLLSYIVEDLHHLDDLVASKDLGRRLLEMQDFVSRERQAEVELDLLRFLAPAEVADA